MINTVILIKRKEKKLNYQSILVARITTVHPK